MTILVVDDDTLVLDVLASLLKTQGHAVLAAPDPSAAATLVARAAQPPDLLLVDVALPGISGIDYAADMRRQYPGLAIVFTTGFAHLEAPARRRGMGEILRKPFRPRELFDIVERARAATGGTKTG